MKLRILPLILFLIIALSCYSTAVVDVGIENVTVTELSPDYPGDSSPEPGELFKVNVEIKNYGDETAEGNMIVYLDDSEKDSLGTFSINPGEMFSHKFTISHDECGIFNVLVKIFMEDNTLNHDWKLSKVVKIGNRFYVSLDPEKPVVDRKVQIDIKDGLGNSIGNAKIWIGSNQGIKYKGGTTHENEVFSFTPDRTGEFVLSITKDEGYCEYRETVVVKHELNVRGPYCSRSPADPIAEDELVIRVYDENNKPIPGVAITLKGHENIYLNTDQSGFVLFFVNKPGVYSVELEKNTPPFWSVNKTLNVRAKPPIVISVSPEKPLQGRDATIKILNENITALNITVTNPGGFSRTLAAKNNEIKFNPESAGTYILNAEKKDYEDLNETLVVYNLLKILIENPVLGNDVTITVLDHHDYPVPDAVLSISGSDEAEFIKNTDHNGEVIFKLKSREYKLTAEKKNSITANAVITPRIRKLSLNLSSRNLTINEPIYISVTEKDADKPVTAKITIKGEKGFKHEETSSGFNFTPAAADIYEITASKEYYEIAKDTLVVKPGLAEYECPKSCECMSREDAKKIGYELCGGKIRECNRECNSTGNCAFYCFEKPTVGECENITLTVTRRITPKIISAPGYINVYLTIKPESSINGVIITEKIPEGLEPVWYYSAVTFSDVCEKVKAMPFTDVDEITNPVNTEWISKRPQVWNPETREAKWWILNDNGIKQQTIRYKLKLSNISKYYDFKGEWELSSGETCAISGENRIISKLDDNSSVCLVSDPEMLMYIYQWNNNKLSDIEILKLIHACSKISTGNLTGNGKQKLEGVIVSREFPKKVNTSSEVALNLKLNVLFNGIPCIIIKEKIPGCWNVSYISNKGNFNPGRNEIKWIIYGEVETQTLSYGIISPSVPGNYTFTGNYVTLEEGITGISGNEKINVEIPAGDGYGIWFFVGFILAAVIIIVIIIRIKRKEGEKEE